MDPTETAVALPACAVWRQADNLTDTTAKKSPISERLHSEKPPPSNAESSVSRIVERMEFLEQTVSDLQAERQLLEECREDDAATIQHLRGQLQKQWQRTVHLTASLVEADCAETAGRQSRQLSSCCFGSSTDLGKEGSRSAEKSEQHKLRLIVAQLEDEVEREREAAAKQRAALLTSVDTAESAAEELLAQSKLWENRCEVLESRMEQQKQMMVARLIQAQGSWQ